MTHALNRLAGLVSASIPDISGIPLRRQIGIVAAVSLLINIVVVIIAALIFDKPVKPIPFALPKLRARGIDLTIIPPEPEPEPIVPFTLAPPDQPFIDSRGLEISREAALNPIFQSDENMRAASELPASGNVPLPSQAGRERPFNAFKTQKSLLGSLNSKPFPSAQDQAPLTPPIPPIPPAAVAQNTPPPPQETPEKPPEKPPEKTEPASPPPSPIEPPKSVPKPDDIAMGSKVPSAITKLQKAPPTPAPLRPPITPRPLPEEQQQQAMLTTPPPRPQPPQTQPQPQPPPRDSGYQPEQEQNRIEGSISNRGRKGVDSVATPLARYRKQVNDAIGSRWYYYIKDPQRMSLVSTGSARVTFSIDQDGRVSDIRLEGNTSNASYAELCIDAVRDAREQIKELKLPVDATIPLKDGHLEFSLTFTFYNL